MLPIPKANFPIVTLGLKEMHFKPSLKDINKGWRNGTPKGVSILNVVTKIQKFKVKQ